MAAEFSAEHGVARSRLPNLHSVKLICLLNWVSGFDSQQGRPLFLNSTTLAPPHSTTKDTASGRRWCVIVSQFWLSVSFQENQEDVS